MGGVGFLVGFFVGFLVGFLVGFFVGFFVGFLVGLGRTRGNGLETGLAGCGVGFFVGLWGVVAANATTGRSSNKECRSFMMVINAKLCV